VRPVKLESPCTMKDGGDGLHVHYCVSVRMISGICREKDNLRGANVSFRKKQNASRVVLSNVQQ
jgi:hypothetical protein